MPKKASKLWKELFSPPCPKCKGTRTKEELRDMPVVASGYEMIEILRSKMAGKPLKPIRTWKCLDCETVFDEKGRCITHEK